MSLKKVKIKFNTLKELSANKKGLDLVTTKRHYIIIKG